MLRLFLHQCRIIMFLFTVISLNGQQVTKNYNSFIDWQNSEFKGLQVDAEGILRLGPTSRRIIQVPEGIIWAFLPDGRDGGFISAGNDGRIFRLSGGQLKPFAQMKGGIVFAMTRLGEDLIVAPSGQRRLVRINSLGESSTYAAINARIVWQLESENREILALGAGERGAVLISAREGSSRVLAEMAEEIAFTSFARDARGSYLLGTHGNGLVVKYNRATDRLETLFDSGMDEVRNIVVSGDRVFASANIERPILPDISKEIPTVTPQDIYFPSESDLKTKSILFEYDLDSKFSRTLWQSQQSFAFALTLWKNHLLLGTGDRSRIFSFDIQKVPTLKPSFALIQELNCAQATAFISQGSIMYVVGSNPGEIYTLSDSNSTEGYLESEILVSPGLTRWGRPYIESKTPNGTSVSIQFRSGQTRRPDVTWSPWSPLMKSGERPGVPVAKFAQFRVKMLSTVDGLTPEVKEVKFFWALQARTSQVKSIEVLPPGIYLSSKNTNTLTAPPQSSEILYFLEDDNEEQGDTSRNFRKGIQGFIFKSDTENTDQRLFRIALRGEQGNEILLEEQFNTYHFAFDTTSYKEGVYELQVTAFDRWKTITSTQQDGILSSRFTIDHEAPKVDQITMNIDQQTLLARFLLKDLRSIISHCFISFNGQDWQQILPDDGIFDQTTEEFTLRLKLSIPLSSKLFIRTVDGHTNESISSYLLPVVQK